jgi:hypothetical protein
MLIAFAAWSTMLSALIVFATKTRVPVFTGMAILVIVNGVFDLNDNHPIRCVVRMEPANPILIGNAFQNLPHGRLVTCFL